jgi:tripartite-type tricarboxylate transporter receptor subunit TctC
MGDRILRTFTRVVRLLGLATALVFLFGVNAESQAQANFYNGKTITVVVGSAPGGLYDL